MCFACTFVSVFPACKAVDHRVLTGLFSHIIERYDIRSSPPRECQARCPRARRPSHHAAARGRVLCLRRGSRRRTSGHACEHREMCWRLSWRSEHVAACPGLNRPPGVELGRPSRPRYREAVSVTCCGASARPFLRVRGSSRGASTYSVQPQARHLYEYGVKVASDRFLRAVRGFMVSWRMDR